MDEKLEQARRRWLAQTDDASEREYHVALERAGWPWETAHLQRVGGWRLERVLCGYALGAHVCSAASFSRDGRRLVTSDESRVRVWDVATRRRVRGGGPIAEETDLLSVSPDGTSVLFVPGRWRGASPAELWRLDPWEQLATYEVDGARLDDATHLADGAIVTVHGDGVVRVWSVDGALEREVVHGDPPHAHGRGRVVARPGGGFVTIMGGDPRPMVWPATGARGRRCARPTGFAADAAAPRLAVSQDDRLAAGSWAGEEDDGGVALFDLSTFEVVAARRGELGAPAFAGDALLLGHGSVFEALGLVDLADHEFHRRPEGTGSGLATSHDGRLACLGGALVDTTSWSEVLPAAHRGAIQQAGFTPGTSRGASVTPNSVLAWDLEAGRLERSLPTRAPATLESPAWAALDPGGGVVHRVDLRSFQERPIAGLRGARPLAFQARGSLVAETTRDGVVVVDFRDGNRRWSWSDTEADRAGLWGTVAAFSVDDRRLFLAGREGLVALDVASGALRFKHPWPEQEVPLRRLGGAHVRALAASPVAGTLLALTTDARLVTFDGTTGGLRGVVPLDGPADRMCVGARGDVVYLQDDRGWRAVDPRTGRAISKSPPEPACPVDFRLPVEAEERASALAVSEDGQRLLMGTNAGSLLLYARSTTA